MKRLNFLFLAFFSLASLTPLHAMEQSKDRQVNVPAVKIKKTTYPNRWPGPEDDEPPCPLSAVTTFGTPCVIKVKTQDGSIQYVPYDWNKEQERWDRIKAQEAFKQLLTIESKKEKTEKLNILSLEVKQHLLGYIEYQKTLIEKAHTEQEKFDALKLFIQEHLDS